MRAGRAIWIVLGVLVIIIAAVVYRYTTTSYAPTVQKTIDLNNAAGVPTVVSGGDSIKFVAVPPPYPDTYVTFLIGSPCQELTLELQKNGSAICTIPKTAQLGQYCYGPSDRPVVGPRTCPACEITVIRAGGPTPKPFSCQSSDTKSSPK
jgi:hypothetical protein